VKVTDGVISTIAGYGVLGFSGDGGNAALTWVCRSALEASPTNMVVPAK
jgi:hypothetical protein